MLRSLSGKVAGLIKVRLQRRGFFCEHCKISKNNYSEEHLRMAAFCISFFI